MTIALLLWLTLFLAGVLVIAIVLSRRYSKERKQANHDDEQ